jgi:RNA polymerase sigma-70 factor (ECF subfamily)
VSIDVEATYSRYGPLVLRRCRRLLGDEHLAVDAMHDVFVLLLRRSGRLDSRSPAGLLFRMATNVCLNRLRSRRRRPETADEDLLAGIVAAEDTGSRALARSLLRSLFGGERESTQAMAVMHLLDGMTYHEIGAEVGLSAAGVRKRLGGLLERVARRGAEP